MGVAGRARTDEPACGTFPSGRLVRRVGAVRQAMGSGFWWERSAPARRRVSCRRHMAGQGLEGSWRRGRRSTESGLSSASSSRTRVSLIVVEIEDAKGRVSGVGAEQVVQLDGTNWRRARSPVGPVSLFSAVNSPLRRAPARDIAGAMVHSRRRAQPSTGGGCTCEDGTEFPSPCRLSLTRPHHPTRGYASTPRSRTGLGRTMGWSCVVGDAAPARSQWSDGHCGPGTGGRRIRGRRLPIDSSRWNAQRPCR